jgi:hypothetical protein
MKSLLVVLLFLIPFTFCYANIIHVPAQAPTIQQGIDQALAGDTVLVAEGHYYEQISFKGKAITVSSQFIIDGDTSHITKTIIDASLHADPDSGSVVYFVNGETKNSILCGFTVTGGSGSVTNYQIGNFADMTSYAGGGIRIWTGGTIEHNRIINNVINPGSIAGIPSIGGGIEAIGRNNNDTIVIRNNEISKNTVNTYWGGGAGIYIITVGYILFENNIVTENICTSSYGFNIGGIGVEGDGDIIISGNLVKKNISMHTGVSSYTGGGVIFIQNSSPQLYNNIIMENSVDKNGGGINLYYDWGIPGVLRPILINNTIINNTAVNGGGISIQSQSAGNNVPILFNNIVWGNTATMGNGIYLQTGTVNLYHSLVQDSAFSSINNSVFCADPLFSDSLGHLSNQSPCLGSGTSSLYLNGTLYRAPSTDITGNPRPSAVDTLVDIGAYESDYAALAFPSSFNLSSIFIPPTPGTMHFTSEILNPHQQTIHAFSKIYTDDGSSRDSVELFDDGLHGDGLSGDGLFGASYQIAMEDIFTASVAVQNSSKGTRFEYGDNQKFTTIGPVTYKGYTIVTSGDGTINPGETHRIKLQLQNMGQNATATIIKATMTALDTFVTISTNGFLFNDIPAGQTALSTNYRTLKFSNNISWPVDTIRLAIDITSDGYTFWRDTTFNIYVVTGMEPERQNLPVVYSLEQNYPNPFNPTTTIQFSLPRATYVTLNIYNPLGQEVAQLVSQQMSAGTYTTEWNASDSPSGVYFYRLQAGSFTRTKKLVLLR